MIWLGLKNSIKTLSSCGSTSASACSCDAWCAESPSGTTIDGCPACDSDLARELSARNSAHDSEYFSRQNTFLLVDEDPDFLFLDGRHSARNAARAAYARTFI